MDIIVYSTPACSYCYQLKEFLRSQGIEFEEIDVSRNQEAARRIVEKTEQMGVPVTEIDGEFIVGFDLERLQKKLDIKI